MTRLLCLFGHHKRPPFNLMEDMYLAECMRDCGTVLAVRRVRR